MLRLPSFAALPRQYGFLGRHSAKSFVTYNTYNFGSAAFRRLLTIPHGLTKAPMHDMWMMKVASITGDAVADFPAEPDQVYHTPAQLYSGVFPAQSMDDAFYCSTDGVNAYVHINHRVVTSGTYHVYFHVKLYIDDFSGDLYDGVRT